MPRRPPPRRCSDCLQQGAPHALGRKRQFRDARADGSRDGVRDHRPARDDRRLAHRFCAVRSDRRRHFHQYRLELRHLTRLGHRVVHEAGGDRRAGLVVDDLLVDCPAHALRAATMDLLLDGGWIDRASDVLDDDVAQRLDAEGLGVDPHPRDVDPGAGASLGDGRFALAQHRLVLRAERRAQPIDVAQRLDLAGHALDAHLAIDHLQILNRRLHLGGGDVQHPLAGFLSRFEHGWTHRVDRFAATGGAGVRRRIRIDGADAHLIGALEAEGLGRDDLQTRIGARQVDRADCHHERAIRLQTTQGRRRLRAAEPAAQRDAHTFVRTSRGQLGTVDRFRTLETLQQTDRRPRRAIRADVATAGGVLLTYLDLVHAQPGDELVDQALAREDGLRQARGAVRPSWRLVGDDFCGVDVQVLPAIEHAETQRRVRRRRAWFRAGVEDDLAFQRGERAVLTRPSRDAEDRRRRWTGGAEVLDAREAQAYGAIHGHRAGGDQRLDQAELATEPAADGHGIHPHLRGRLPQHRRHRVACAEHRLGARIHHHVAQRIDGGGADLRLQVALVNPRGAVLPRDDDVRLRQCLVGVTALVALMTGHIRRLGLFLLTAAGGGAVHAQLLFVLGGAHAHDRRIWPHRVEWVDGWRQGFVFDLDALCAVLRGGLALGQDHRHRLAYVRGAFEGHDDAAVVDRGADVAHGQILGGEDGH